MPKQGVPTPGLIGFVKAQASAECAGPFLERMALALESGAQFQRTLHHEPGVGLGRVGLAVAGTSGMAWNPDETVCVVLEGEIYDVAALEHSLAGGPGTPPAASHAELVLRVFERFGTAGIERLNGAFAVAVWDRRTRRLQLFNDRLGLLPLYYARVGGGLLFGSGVRALLADPDLARTVDRVAMNQFMVHDHMLDDRTLLESVRLLPQASVLTFKDGQLALERYWRLRYPEVYEPRPEEEYVEGLIHHLRQAVERQRPDSRPSALLLSGGLDSRVLAGLLCGKDKPVRTLTFGIPGCDDARVAREVASALSTDHRFFELKPDWLLALADEAVRVTDGLGNIVNLHVLGTLDQQSQHAQVLYKGFFGDALLGWPLRRQMWADYPPEVAHEVHRSVYRSQGTLIYERSEQKQLFSDAFQSQVGDAASDSFCEGMDRAGTKQLGNQRLYFDLTQRVPRMTLNGVEVARQRTVVRLPFCDNDLLNFVLTVPPGFQFERYLQKAAFIRSFPKLAQIPMAGTSRPLTSCARDVVEQVKSLASWHLRRHGLGFLAARDRRPYKDYDGWFRTVLRPWVEDTLLQPRALDRGYFRPDAVRQLVGAHMGGANHAVRIGALLTVELWHRQFLD